MTLADRQKIAQNKIALDLYQLMIDKKSNLALSLDVPQKQKFFDILERTAEHIVILKTHIDIINNFDADFIKKLLLLKNKYKFLIFEDRKFADIGNTVKLQYTQGIFKTIEWADIVNAHIFPGPGVIEGLEEAWRESKREQGLIILPQMTSRENLFDKKIMAQAIKWAREYCNFVIGFIGAAALSDKPPAINHKVTGDPTGVKLTKKEAEEFKKIMEQTPAKSKADQANKSQDISNELIIKEASLAELRRHTWPEFLIFTPGVKLLEVGDGLGQTYVAPQMAVGQGADIIIVGRGLYQAPEPGKAAAEYQQAGWSALQSTIVNTPPFLLLPNL
jgi:orotidine 5'-phosphate decarboxylase subfamily 1